MGRDPITGGYLTPHINPPGGQHRSNPGWQTETDWTTTRNGNILVNWYFFSFHSSFLLRLIPDEAAVAIWSGVPVKLGDGFPFFAIKFISKPIIVLYLKSWGLQFELWYPGRKVLLQAETFWTISTYNLARAVTSSSRREAWITWWKPWKPWIAW